MSQDATTIEQSHAERLPTDQELREIAASLRGLRFGAVNIVVQDGVIVQIDRTDKKRLRSGRERSRNSDC